MFETIISISLIPVLLIITYQDIKFRGISWYLFPLVSGLLITINLLGSSMYEILLNTSLNLAFLSLQLLILIAYFRLKDISIKQFFNQYMGVGDVLFFIVLAFGLDFPLFPFFMVVSLIISLISGVLIFKKKTVPLAGLQAIMLLGLYVAGGLEINFIQLTNLNW